MLLLEAHTPRRAPAYAVQLLDGQRVTLASQLGKVVLLAFVNTDCPHCLDTCRLMQRLQEDYGARGVQMLAVAFDQRAKQDLPLFVRRCGAKFPVGWDTPAALLRFLEGLRGGVYVPVVVFIDRLGMIRGSYVGDDPFLAENQEKNLRAMLDKLAAETPGRRSAPRF
jgi:peroxiredoxin